MNDIRTFIIAIVSGLLALLSPIKDFMHAMILVFVINFFCGLIADYRSGGKWSTKKAMLFFYSITVFFVLISTFFVIGKFMHNPDEALFSVKFTCLFGLWVFSVNITKNLKIMLIEGSPMWHIANFLHFILSLKVINKIPFLNDYLTITKAFGKENTGERSNGNQG
ncbi:hypothetical protein [Hoylesella nanceiensis]|uniref:hypothetical protein n=1 Tax=Hoylesella nanceiensis TaxID=425941 RepID=UPI00241DFEAE|nr:hypothetical protein [Hoylesella nanceiensis]